MAELIVVLDVGTSKPDRDAFESIGMLDELHKYNQKGDIDWDIYEFYFECLADYIHIHLKENKGQQAKKRFIVYFNARSPNSLKAEEVFGARKEDVEQYGKDFEFLDFVYGNQPLFLFIGCLWKDQISIVRFITKEKWFVSKDLINTFENCFKNNSKLYTISKYKAYSKIIKRDFKDLLNLSEKIK